VSRFERAREVAYREHFKQWDVLVRGSINKKHLRTVIRAFGFSMTPAAISELIEEVDPLPQRVDMTWDQFKTALNLVHTRYGFTRSEVHSYEELFDRYDEDGSGDISPEELTGAMGWLGLPTSVEQAQAAIDKFDIDGSTQLCKPEFLLAVRWWRDAETLKIKKLFEENDEDGNGFMDMAELKELFLRLGYTISDSVIMEGIRDVMSHTSGLFFEEVLQLLEKIRSQEGWSKQEKAELLEVFHKYENDDCGSLKPFELARALNWLGYPLTQHHRSKLWVQVDVDKSGSLEESEFLKLMRILREEETRVASDFVARHAAVSAPPVTEQDIRDMLGTFNFEPSEKVIADFLKSIEGAGNLEVGKVHDLMQGVREAQIEKLRQYAGLPLNQVSKIRAKFGARFESVKGVDATEMEKLIYALYPAARHSQDERDKVRKIITDYAKPGQTEFGHLTDVFWVVRLYGEACDEAAYQREMDVIKETGFSPVQVAQFREAFVGCDADGSGYLSEEEILGAFDDFMALTMNQTQKLHEELEKLGDQAEFLDFPEFMRLMRIVLDCGKPSMNRTYL